MVLEGSAARHRVRIRVIVSRMRCGTRAVHGHTFSTEERRAAAVAQIREVRLVDDIDGEAADETVEFGIDGKSYEIDLSKDNAGRLRDALADFVSAARRAGGRRRGSSAGTGTASGGGGGGPQGGPAGGPGAENAGR